MRQFPGFLGRQVLGADIGGGETNAAPWKPPCHDIARKIDARHDFHESETARIVENNRPARRHVEQQMIVFVVLRALAVKVAEKRSAIASTAIKQSKETIVTLIVRMVQSFLLIGKAGK